MDEEEDQSSFFTRLLPFEEEGGLKPLDPEGRYAEPIEEEAPSSIFDTLDDALETMKEKAAAHAVELAK